MLVQLEFDQVLETELFVLVWDFLVDVCSQALPVTVFHEFRVQLLYKGHHLSHVLHALVQRLEGLPGLDLLVESVVRVAEIRLEALDLHLEVIWVDTVPQSLGPVSELVIDKRNQIPDVLQLLELLSAVVQSFIFVWLNIEKSLQVV